MTKKNSNVNAKEKKKEKANESGRTMMEMLGTLALIGLLSVGGVSGYGRAINAYRANAILDTAQKKAIEVNSTINKDGSVTPNLNEAIKTPSGYQVTETTSTGKTNTIESTDGYFGIKVGETINGGTAVPVDTAKVLLEKSIDSWKYVYGFGIKTNEEIHWVNKLGSGAGGFDEAVGENGTVVIILVFAVDLSLRPGELLDGQQIVTETCSNLIKIRKCDGSLENCCPDTNICIQPTNCACQDDKDCYGEQMCVAGVCTCKFSEDYELNGEKLARLNRFARLGNDGTTCCYIIPFEHSYISVKSNSKQPDVCGCVDGAVKRTTVNGPICCPGGGLIGIDGQTCCDPERTGASWDYFDDGWKVFDPTKCGCPDDGVVKLSVGLYDVTHTDDGKICCKNGRALDYEGKYTVKTDFCK